MKNFCLPYIIHTCFKRMKKAIISRPPTELEVLFGVLHILSDPKHRVLFTIIKNVFLERIIRSAVGRVGGESMGKGEWRKFEGAQALVSESVHLPFLTHPSQPLLSEPSQPALKSTSLRLSHLSERIHPSNV